MRRRLGSSQDARLLPNATGAVLTIFGVLLALGWAAADAAIPSSAHAKSAQENAAERNSPDAQLILDADLAGLGARLSFNGVTLAEFKPGEPVRYSARLGGWAQDGANRLEVAWQVPAASRAAPRLIVTVREIRGNRETTLLRFKRSPDAPLAQTIVQEVRFKPAQHWRWLDADRILAVAPADRAAIVALLSRVRGMMVEKNHAGLLAAQHIQIGEQAIASGSTPDEALAVYGSFLADQMSDKGWEVEPMDPASLRMDPMAGGRIIAITGASGGPAIKARSAQGSFELTPFVSRFGGVWQIVR